MTKHLTAVITVEVDDDMNDEALVDYVTREFGWLEQSGIFLEELNTTIGVDQKHE